MNSSIALSETQKRNHEKLKRELGKDVVNALLDDEIIEIMLNSDNTLWVDRLGVGMSQIPNHLCQGQAAIHTIASYWDTTITRDNPVLECNLPLDGSRFEAVIPPAVENPSFTIRKKAKKIFTLSQYNERGMLTPTDKIRIQHEIPTNISTQELLEFCVKNKKNILISGGTGSGKTTLTNALIHAMSQFCEDDRIIIIEDALEIQCLSRNNVIFRSSKDNPNMTINRMLAVCMRYRPDRILVGEVRGKEALSLLESWNTGHPGGICTVHADNALLTLTRLELLVRKSEDAKDLGSDDIKFLIATAVDVIISISKTESEAGRNVQEIIEVMGYDPSKKQYITRSLI